ncbi:hypothetical protein BKA69DRAFT_1179207 [Paraphysoderma sedebokerense]|nr:hypothetical protein BKA69DRAFT_1179207 [Paraphysoderma sedebokerense]
MNSVKAIAGFLQQHGTPLGLVGASAVAIFAAGAYFNSLKVELTKEKELRVKELELRDKELQKEKELRLQEKELRDKELQKERELREKDAIIARKASSEAELRALRLFFDVKHHADYESLQKRLRLYESSQPEAY